LFEYIHRPDEACGEGVQARKKKTLKMSTGYIFMFTGLLSFAAMGIVHKLGDRYHGSALNIALFTMGSSCILSLIYAAISHPGPMSPFHPIVALVALPFGVAAGSGLWVFQKGLRYGHIATSWLLVNLSAGVPTVLSTVIYHEPLGWKKLGILLLIAVSLVLLWWDRKHTGVNSPDSAPIPVFDSGKQAK
jgi:drug/metabolite transporter (DMT)-like permease